MDNIGGGLMDADRQDEVVQQPVSGVNRVVLKNATLSIVVDEPETKIGEIAVMAEEMGGWVVTSNSYNTTHASGATLTQGSITVRAPAERLNEAMSRIKTGAGEVKAESITGEDVTQSYVDLTSRLANLEAAEEQLQAIMEEVRRTEDVLAVYTELVSIRGEIESIKGQVRFYDESAAFSSIQVTVAPTPITRPLEVAGWRPLDVARDAFQALINVAQATVNIAIFTVVFFGPLLVVIGLPVWLVLRRRRRARAAAAQA
jgi:hypothetical protein